MLNLNVLVQLCLIHTPRHFSGLRNTTEEFRNFEASSKKYYFESHKIHLIATPGFRRLWLHRFLVTPKTRKDPVEGPTSSCSSVDCFSSKCGKAMAKNVSTVWATDGGWLEPTLPGFGAHELPAFSAFCWRTSCHFLCRIFYEAKSRGPSHATSGKKRKGSRTQSLPYEVLGRPCVIAFWPVETLS